MSFGFIAIELCGHLALVHRQPGFIGSQKVLDLLAVVASDQGKVFAIVTTCVIVAAAVIFVVVSFQDGGTRGLENPEQFNSLGNYYIDSGQYQRAIKNLDNAIRINPIYVEAYVNRGRSYSALG